MSRVYVGNLGDGASKRELEREFEAFGPLRDVWVARNPPGFAFVVFEDKRDAEDAVNDLDGRTLCGTKIRVELARGPTRGGRAARLGLTEKCYECGRIGHYARDCTRRPGFVYHEGRGRRHSRSRSPPRRRRRYSRSRSRSPPRRRERSRSYERRGDRRSPSRSRSRSGSPARERKSYSRERSPSPNQERNGDMKVKQDNEDVGDNRSRSASPVV